MRHIAKNNCMLTKFHNNVAFAQFNRPDKLNAVNLEMCEDILESTKLWNENSIVTILQGQGRAFTVGGDLKSVLNIKQGKQEKGQVKLGHLGDEAKKSVYALSSTQSILVTIMNGFTMGVGAGFGIHSDIRVATENTVFSMPECKVGIVPDGGCGYYFSRMPYHFGLYLGMSGEQANGIQMCHLGIADFLIESNDIPVIEHEIETSHLLRDLDSLKDFLSHKYCKKSKTHFDVPVEFRNAFNQANLPSIMSILDHSFPEQSAKIRANCPFCVYGFYEYYNRNIKYDMSIKDNLMMEQAILDKTVHRHDMVEGLKALFVDRTYKPKFNPATIEEVDLDELEKCFEPCPRRIFD